MVWLAIDTSSQIATYALKVGEQIYTREQHGVATHAQTILTLINDLLKEAGIELKDISNIVVGRGPGSFTGLRVACAVVKGLAFVNHVAIYPVSNLALIAWIARKKYPKKTILSVIDARMQQVYWALYTPSNYAALEYVDSIAHINAPEHAFVLAGYNFHEYSYLIPPHWPIIAQEQINTYAVAMIEMCENNLITPVTVAQLEPVYVREQVTQG